MTNNLIKTGSRIFLFLAGGESLEIAEEMAAFEALKRLFEVRPSDFVFKFGQCAHNLNYTAHNRPNPSISEWTPDSDQMRVTQ